MAFEQLVAAVGFARRGREKLLGQNTKRREIIMARAAGRISRRSGGGGNRTRVRGRTGQNVYKRSPRFSFDRRPEADVLPTV